MKKKINTRTAITIILLVMLNALVSLLLWRYEFSSHIDGLRYLKHLFRQSELFPWSAISIAMLTTLSFLLALSPFAGKQKRSNYVLAFVLISFVAIVSFYAFSHFLVGYSLKGWIRETLSAFLFAVLVIIPMYGLLVTHFVNSLLIRTSRKLILWLCAAFVSTVPLGWMCVLIAGDQVVHDYYFLTATQKGYPIVWIHMTIALATFFYYRRSAASA